MEAVPRLPMLNFEMKSSSDGTNFGSKLKQFIRDFYHEDPEMYSNEIRELEGLRASAVRPVRDVTGCSALKRYYCQLHFLQSRFPMEEDGACAVHFSWLDNYSGVVYTVTDIRYEMACILYNIGALHTELGACDSRQSADGMKLSCTHFQCAAWAFQHLKDTFPQPRGSDLSPDILLFMNHLTLAQAQECILEKSMMDNRKATIIAKVAAQIVDYYNLALNSLTQGSGEQGSVAETVGSKLFKNWKRYVKFKIAYHGCISLLFQGQQAEELQKMGERLAYYQAAFEKLEEAIKSSKGMEKMEAVSEALTFTMDVVEGKRKAAKNDNEYIYHEKVPDKDSLPEVKGASLVKGIPFSVNDTEVSGPDIFARLVPMEAHEASSLYSEEKAKLMRRIGTMIEEKNQHLAKFRTSLQLDQLHLFSEPERLSQDLVDRCAAMNAKPDAIQNLIDSMGKLAETYHDVESMLKDISDLLQEEEKKEKEYQTLMGKRPQSNIITELVREANKYQEAHAKASESNTALHNAMTLHISNLRLLSNPLSELQKHIPSITSLESPADDAAEKELQRILDKVDEMCQQREMLFNQLRESTCQDDITTRLVTHQGENRDQLFSNELQKHNKYVTLLEKNLDAQDNILKALTDAYAACASMRKSSSEIMRKREAMISALILSYDAYEDLLAKSSKGFEFYKKLEGNVNKLFQRVRSVIKVQDEEREQMLLKSNKTFSKPLPNLEKTDTVKVEGTGLKLKDYLQHMKKGGFAGIGATSAVTSAVPSAGSSYPGQPYYPYPYGQAPVAAGNTSVPSGSYQGHSSTPVSSSETTTWMPGIRPAPVGSEGTDQNTSVCSTPSKVDDTSSKDLPSGRQPMGAHTTQSAAGYSQVPSAYSSYSSAPSANPYQYNPQLMNYYAKNYSDQAANLYHEKQSNKEVGKTDYYYNPQYQQGTGQQYPAYSNTASPKVSNISTPNTTIASSSQPTYSSGTYGGANPQIHQSQVASTQGVYSSGPSPYQPSNSTYSGSQYPGYSTASQPVFTQPNQYYSTASEYIPDHYTRYPQTSQPYANQPTSQGYPHHSSQAGQTPTLPYSYQGYMYQPATGQYQYVGNYQGTQAGQYSAQAPQAGQYNTQAQAYPAPQATTVSVTCSPTYQSTQAKSASSSADESYQYGQQFHAKKADSNTSVDSGSSSEMSRSSAHRLPVQGEHSYVQVAQFASPRRTMAAISSSGYQYMTGSPGVSSYTSAGKYATLHTASSQMSVEGQTFAAQYLASQNGSTFIIPQYSQTNDGYYSLQYGCQFSQNQTAPKTETTEVSQPNNGGTPYMTYMQARMPSAMTQTTYSQKPKTPSNTPTDETEDEQSSNVDLLAGLDFSNASVNQPPLIPQQNSSKKEEKSPKVSQVQNHQVLDAAEKPGTPKSAPAEHEAKVESRSKPEEANHTPTKPKVKVDSSRTLSPEKVQSTSRKESKESSEQSKQATKGMAKDPYLDPEFLNQFAQEVEKYEKFVDGLTKKSLNGPTPLDMKWKELQDLQEKDSHKLSISVARCYPMKNRFPDILPYDHSRVELPSTKDDYINASFVQGLTPLCPQFIVTQMPLPSTYADFWTMVWEQQVEVVVCLLNDSELQKQIYWPKEKGEDLVIGKMQLTLQSSNVRSSWVERIISLCITETRTIRVVVHLQFTGWPGSSFPASPGPFLNFVSEVLNFSHQQRNLSHPLVAHCLSGVGRTGLFCLVLAAMAEINAGHGIIDMVQTTVQMSQQRKGSLRDREHLKFAYQAVLYYAQDLLMKRGILTSRSTFEDKIARSGKSHTRHPSEDFLLGPVGLSQLQSGIEKMGLGTNSSEKMEATERVRRTSGSSQISSGDDSVTTEMTRSSGSPQKAGSSHSTPSRKAINSNITFSGSLPELHPSLSLLSTFDPVNFDLDLSSNAGAKKHFSKENFTSKESLEKHVDSDDPLSQLDPLWSLKRDCSDSKDKHEEK